MSSDEDDSMELDGLVMENCLSCGGEDGGDGMKLMTCSVIGCPIAVHEECMSPKSEIDDNGRFYCRYCAHKRAVVRAAKLRRRKAARDKEFSVPVIDLEGRDENADRNRGEIEDIEMTVHESEKGGQEMPIPGMIVSTRSTKSCESAKGAASCSKKSGITELNRNEKVTSSCFDLNEVLESDRNEKATNALSSEAREVSEPSRNEKAIEVLSESRKVPDSGQNEKTTSSALESRSEDLLFRISKRRKVHWTADELKMLEAGVQIFSAQVKKNLPWRRILELGRGIFHETRTPDNLKDKWKVLCREASNNKQT